jgi:hypothetical protein
VVVTPSNPSVSPWPLWQRVGFRYLLLHWLLYAFTDPQGNPLISLFGVIRFGLGKVAGWARDWSWFDVDLTGWIGPVFEWLVYLQGSRLDLVDGKVGPSQGWCLRFTSWLSETSAELSGGSPVFEVFHQPTGSGDTMHDLVKLCSIMVFAGLLTIVWSLIDRSRDYPRLGRWLHLGARWYVALQMLGYGMAKFYGFTQFPEPGISALTREIGDHSPMGMVWTFMGASTPYKYFGGVSELLGFALLLHRRTALLGCFVTAGVMTNVCALNFLYGVPVKLYSGHLLLIAFFLMAPYAGRLWALFFSNRSSEPVDIRVVHSRWLGWPLLALGWLWAMGLLWSGHEGRTAMMSNPRYAKMMARPELFGLWKVERMRLDGAEVPPSDSSRWKYLAFDRGNLAFARTLLGQAFSFDIVENLEADEVTLTQRGGKATGEVWTIERSTVTRKVRNPAPKKRGDWGGRIDAEVPAIVFRGNWKGKAIELHTVRKQFRLHDSFRLVREFPR